MKSITLFAAAVLALSPVAAPSAVASSFNGHCPPGLAKKNPPCIPPGLAKKIAPGYHSGRYHVGDHLPRGEYDRIRDRYPYGLPRLRPGEVYYRVGDSIVRIDRETREILQLIEAVARVTN